MIEFLFELTISAIDYAYLLYFYLLLIGMKWEWKKVVPGILCAVCVQYTKEQILFFNAFSMFFDTLLVICFLMLYSRKLSLKNFLYAIVIDAILFFTITFSVACAIEFGIDVNGTMQFGIARVIFSLLIKCITIVFLSLVVHPLIKLQHLVNDGTEKMAILLMILVTITFSFIYGESQGNSSIFMFICLLSFIMIFVLYLFYRYCVLTTQKADVQIMKHAMDITLAYVNKLDKEHDEIRKIRHDLHNQLTILNLLLKEQKYDEATRMLNQLQTSLDIHKVSLSGNIYIDAVLRKKCKSMSILISNWMCR